MARVPQESASKPRPFYGRNESQMPHIRCEGFTACLQYHPSISKLNTFTQATTAPLWTMATCHGDAALPSWTFSTFGELGTGRRNCAHLFESSLSMPSKVAIISITTLQCLTRCHHHLSVASIFEGVLNPLGNFIKGFTTRRFHQGTARQMQNKFPTFPGTGAPL